MYLISLLQRHRWVNISILCVGLHFGFRRQFCILTCVKLLLPPLQNMEDPMSDIPLDTRHADARNSKKSRRKASLKDIPKAWLNLPPVEQQD